MAVSVTYNFDNTRISTPYLICIDDKNKPRAIDNNNWIVEGNIYVCDGFLPTESSPDGCILLEGKDPGYHFKGYDKRRLLPFLFSPN